VRREGVRQNRRARAGCCIERLFTLEALEAGLALGAVLRALAALVLVAVPADGEGALVAGDEGLAVGVEPHVVAANLAHLPVLLVHRLRLPGSKNKQTNKRTKKNQHRDPLAGDADGLGAHVPPARHRGG
jgi:hypothetical protein